MSRVSWSSTLPPAGKPLRPVPKKSGPVQWDIRSPATPLVHLQQSCPGLSGATANTDIHPLCLGHLLETTRHLVIPLFQRTYCWLPHHAEGWWNDILKLTVADVRSPDVAHDVVVCRDAARAVIAAAKAQDSARFATAVEDLLSSTTAGAAFQARHSLMHCDDGRDTTYFISAPPPPQPGQKPEVGSTWKHTVGKLVITRRASDDDEDAEASPGETVWVLDGQQRLTTTSLLLAAIRDNAAGHAARILAALRDGTAPGSAIVELCRLGLVMNDIASFLFNDSSAANEWAASVARRALAAQTTAVWADETEAWFLGARPAWLRLCPSLADRGPFVSFMLRGLVLWHMALQSPAPVEVHGALLPEPLALAASHQAQLFTVFAKNLGTRTDAAAPAAFLASVVARGTFGFYCVQVDARPPINIAQSFLWMQEKTLFGMGALLYNPSPGINFRACDLIRNLVVAPWESEPLAVQEEVYGRLWQGTVERACRCLKATTLRAPDTPRRAALAWLQGLPLPDLLDAVVDVTILHAEKVAPIAPSGAEDAVNALVNAMAAAGVLDREAQNHKAELALLIGEPMAPFDWPSCPVSDMAPSDATVAQKPDTTKKGIERYARAVSFLESQGGSPKEAAEHMTAQFAETALAFASFAQS